MIANDNDTLEHLEGVLSPAEMAAMRWITLDCSRPFCSGDLTELPQIRSKGTARNIIWKLKTVKLIELFCRSRYAFYKLKFVDQSKIKKPMTLYHMGVNGVRRVKIDFVSLLYSLPLEELCKIHNVHLAFEFQGFYPLFKKLDNYVPKEGSKDIVYGVFQWSKYSELKVILHFNGTISFRLGCSECPIEASTVGFVSMAAFLSGICKELFLTAKTLCPDLSEDRLPRVDEWKVVQWHYGRDSAQEFSGESFNVTFKMWCGELARIYTHEAENGKTVRLEIIQTPDKSLRDAISEKLNLCCSRCKFCSKQS